MCIINGDSNISFLNCYCQYPFYPHNRSEVTSDFFFLKTNHHLNKALLVTRHNHKKLNNNVVWMDSILKDFPFWQKANFRFTDKLSINIFATFQVR